jgi:hypothetical protein
MADVEVVATYELYSISRTKLEKLIHRVFDPACLDIEIKDRFGNPVVPREWFLVPLFVIDEAVEKIRDGIRRAGREGTAADLGADKGSPGGEEGSGRQSRQSQEPGGCRLNRPSHRASAAKLRRHDPGRAHPPPQREGRAPCSRRALAGLVGGQLALANEAARRSSLGFVNCLHRREFSGRRGFFKGYPNKGAQYSEPYGCPVPPAPPGSALCRTQVRVTQPCRNIRSRRSSMRGETAVDRQADPDHEARGRAAQP